MPIAQKRIPTPEKKYDAENESQFRKIVEDTFRQLINVATASDVAGAYAPIDSPAFTGDPRAPTPAPGDSDNSLATTAFVAAALVASLAGYALIASPTFTGDPKAPTPAPGDNDTSIATTAFVAAAIAAAGSSGSHYLAPIADGFGDLVYDSSFDWVAMTLTTF